jgi:trk system potassium uptake protein TrkH
LPDVHAEAWERESYIIFYMQISKWFSAMPARSSILGFLILIAAGTALLMLPASSANSQSLGFIDALFTSTSASCVTGLVVVDTGTYLSRFGQIVILGLIQTGGLGIMTMSTLFILMGGKRLGFKERIVLQDTFTNGRNYSIYSILKYVLIFTLIIEGTGTVCLFLRFIPVASLSEAFYFSIFHSISAFCNAGFSLFYNSFTGYNQDWMFNLIISFMVISGGIGFLVLAELSRIFPFKRRIWPRCSLHTKIVLSSTLILLIISTLVLLYTEWSNTLAPLSVPNRLMAAFFQSVSARTAGFNSVAIGNMANETLFVLILLMFIGASPGSCGGGIKITTFITLIALGISRLFGYEKTFLFKRTIPEENISKAISILLISSAVIIIAIMAILTSELGETAHTASRGKFLELVFEVVSAFGTVGLSTGITAGLSMAGKLIIIFVMFIGRLGPLVIALAVSRRPEKSHYSYAEENIMIG